MNGQGTLSALLTLSALSAIRRLKSSRAWRRRRMATSCSRAWTRLSVACSHVSGANSARLGRRGRMTRPPVEAVVSVDTTVRRFASSLICHDSKPLPKIVARARRVIAKRNDPFPFIRRPCRHCRRRACTCRRGGFWERARFHGRGLRRRLSFRSRCRRRGRGGRQMQGWGLIRPEAVRRKLRGLQPQRRSRGYGASRSLSGASCVRMRVAWTGAGPLSRSHRELRNVLPIRPEPVAGATRLAPWVGCGIRQATRHGILHARDDPDTVPPNQGSCKGASRAP